MQIPEHPQIRSLGYVSDDLRRALLAHARVLVVPSPYESLSIVLLEAWNHGVPALVNARCKVLHGQVRRANGGLYYRTFNEFREALDYWFATTPWNDARSAPRGSRSSSVNTDGRPSSPAWRICWLER